MVVGGVVASLAAGVCVSAGAASSGSRARRRPLGLADITVTKELARDYAGTLKAVAQLGYTHFGFRLAGYGGAGGELASARKAQLVEQAGLKVGVVRFAVGRGTSPIDQIPLALDTGARIVALSAAAPFLSGAGLGKATPEAFEAWLLQLAALSQACGKAGLTLAYHNHWWDLMPLGGGETPLAILARRFSPSELSFEIDLAWAWYAGMAPLDLVRGLGGRVASMHLKDVDRSHGASETEHAVVIGDGEMNYAALLPRLAKATKAVGYVEVDAPADGLVAATRAAAFYRKTIGDPA